jgi:hypothetical protein
VGLLWNREIVGWLFGMAAEKVPFAIADSIGSWNQNKAVLPLTALGRATVNT